MILSDFLGVQGKAYVELMKVQLWVVIAKCSEPQVASNDIGDEGSVVVNVLSL